MSEKQKKTRKRVRTIAKQPLIIEKTLIFNVKMHKNNCKKV